MNDDNMNNENMENGSRPGRFKRVAAIAGVVVILGFITVFFISAFSKSETGRALFLTCMYCLFVCPVIIYLISLFYKLAKKKHEEKDGEAK